MLYMRGKYYIWTSGASEKDYRVHLWVGSDQLIKNSGWAEQFMQGKAMEAALPETVFDELVVMRYAQLQEEGKVEQAEARAIKKHAGNVGCDALCRSIVSQPLLIGSKCSPRK